MKLNPFVVMKEEFDGTGIVFNAENNKVMALNTSGVMMWNALTAGCSIEQAAEQLVGRYDGVNLEQARQDVQAFLQSLRDRDLIAD